MSSDPPRKREPPSRILEITSYPPPRAGWGVRVSYLRRHLTESGHDCTVLNIGRNRRVRSAEYVDVQGWWDYLRKVLRFVRRGYTLHLHINGDGNKGWALALVAGLLAKAWRRPVALTMHAGPLQQRFPKERSRASIPFFWTVFRLSDRIVCNEEAVKTRIQEYAVPAQKIRPIPAFSHQYLRYAPASLDAALEAFLADRAPILVAYLFLRPEFHADSLARAVAILLERQARLGLVLVGADTTTPTCEALVRQHGLGGHAALAGDLDHDRFLTLLSRAHLYVRMPEKDGVCSSVLEALSLGVPVIASENGRRPASVLTVPPGDAGALADAIGSAWARYGAVKASVVTPSVDDTVAEEARLLLDLARDAHPRTPGRG